MYRKNGRVSPFTDLVPTVMVGGHRQTVQVLRCTKPGCACQLEKPFKGKPYPTEVIAKFARNKGWNVNPNTRTFECPNHRGH